MRDMEMQHKNAEVEDAGQSPMEIQQEVSTSV